MLVRPMNEGDDLMPFLVAAMDWRDAHAWDADAVLSTPDVAHYVTGWMRDGDAGVIAESGGAPVGAAWWRHFTSADPGYGYVADDVPEIGLSVLRGGRGAGTGGMLLDALIDLARGQGIRGLSLSVEDGNDAARGMYERRGFLVVGREGDSDTMLLTL